MRTPFLSRILAFAILGLGSACAADAARAGILAGDAFKTQLYTQSADGAGGLSVQGYYFAARVYGPGPGEYTSGSVSGPGTGSPLALSPLDSTRLFGSSPLQPSLGDLDAAFEFGTYDVEVLLSGGGTLNGSFDYSEDTYPLSTPYLDGTTYSDLQGIDATQGFLFQLSPYDTGPLAQSSTIFLSIIDTATDTTVFNVVNTDPTTSSILMAANTLEAGRTYKFDLTYTNRNSFDAPGFDTPFVLGFDQRTQGTFTTAAGPPVVVPEPSTWLLGAQALVVAGWLGRKRLGSVGRA